MSPLAQSLEQFSQDSGSCSEVGLHHVSMNGAGEGLACISGRGGSGFHRSEEVKSRTKSMVQPKCSYGADTTSLSLRRIRLSTNYCSLRRRK